MPSLEQLIASDIDVAAVVTNPDKPAGRGMKLVGSPVKQVAEGAGIEVFQPTSARGPEMHDWLAALAPDVAVVVAYGKILPGELLAVPARGFVNLHFSLLPAYRGAAPVQRAIMNGDETTGVSVMVLTEGMDEGPVLARRREAIDPSDTSNSLGERLAGIGAPLLLETLGPYLRSEIEPEPQDDSMATYAGKITTDDALIDWSADARSIRDLVRALDPDPGAWTMLEGTRLKVLRASLADGPQLPPGEIGTGSGLVVGTGSEPLLLEEVQPATKKRMAGADFARGARLTDGLRMGE